MQKPTNAVLLVGSPKGPNSTSNSLGSYLINRLTEKNVTCKTVFITQSINSPEKQATMLKLIDDSDLIVLAFPLYVDCLHSQVTRTLELIAEHEKGKQDLNKKMFAAIANSGFPEADHNKLALNVCQIFAKQVGFTWKGGLAMGGGGMISGVPLDETRGAARNQIKALEMAAEALTKGEAIPKEAIRSMSKLGIPRWMYTMMGNRGWKQQAKKSMELKEMYNQPFK